MNFARESLHTMQVMGVVLAATLVASPGMAAGVWESRAPMPEVRYGAQVRVIDGQIHLFGGMRDAFSGDTGYAVSASVLARTTLVYDLTADIWDVRDGPPTLRSDPVITDEVGGLVYVIGGNAPRDPWPQPIEPLLAVEAYEPVSGTWHAKASLPSPREGATWCIGAFVVDGTIYVLRCGSGAPVAIDAYDPASGTWAAKARGPVADLMLKACVVNDVIYALGWNDQVSAYDPKSDSWVSKASVPVAPMSLLAREVCVVKGAIYILKSAYHPRENSSGCHVFRYEPAADRWEQKSTLPFVVLNGVSASPDGLIYVFPHEGFCVYSTEHDTASALEAMPDDWFGFSYAQVGRRLHLLGGAMSEGFGIVADLCALNRVYIPEPLAPVVVQPPLAQTVTAGGRIVLSVSVDAECQPCTYQWRFNGIDIPGATGPTFALPCAQCCQAGGYSVMVSNATGSTVSEEALVAVAPASPSQTRFLNLSTRAPCLTDENVLITGFVVSGAGTKQLLLRTVGQALGDWGVAGALADPCMVLKQRVGASWQDVADNDDWGASADAAAIAAVAARVRAFDLPRDGADAAMLVDLPAGTYSVVAGGAHGDTGVVLVELYDADLASAGPNGARLANISTRGCVGIGSDVMIPGFVVSGDGPKTFLLRAIGPTLSAFGVSGVLSDPSLAVYRRLPGSPPVEQEIVRNDDWSQARDAAEIANTAARVGAFALPQDSRDAAMLITLPPGVYTAVASGKSGATGVALVELYEVP